MTANILNGVRAAVSALKPSRKTVVLAVELAGLAAVVFGIALWSEAAALVAGGVGLILEAYALERR